MENIYLFMIIALAGLAIVDLVVGVSNDAVNFLNSAIGSKVLNFKTIMIIASVGIASGAIFSSGLMEVARKGIFVPGEFFFDEIMIIFMAVMITDILLLDFFNSVGMPTSTTVSIVFELLGAAVCMSLIKITNNKNLELSDLGSFINTDKAVEIILGILLSVFVAFSIGAVVQYLSRLLLSFNHRNKSKIINAIFGGLALTAIMYFIFIKGIKGTPYANTVIEQIYNGGTTGLLEWANNYLNTSFESIDTLIKTQKKLLVIDKDSGIIALTLRGFLEYNLIQIASISLIILSFLCYLLIKLFKTDIYKVIIVVGTFALALAFAGNDLVNFIGVPVAAWASYQEWVASGVPASEFSMAILSKKAETPTVLLLIAGAIMVLTLWFSTKAKDVVKTSLDLSRQSEGSERFKSNLLSRALVRTIVQSANGISKILPENYKSFVNKQFDQSVAIKYENREDAPAFDVVRAAVNLMVAGVLISIATSMKLPLSTTYVTFMVAMGTSLADKAWGAESAVYRVAGVLNVIGGWFFTAFSAFSAAAIIALLIHLGGVFTIITLLVIAGFLLLKNTLLNKKNTNKASNSPTEVLQKAESKSIQGVINESAGNIYSFSSRISDIYKENIDGLAIYDLNALKKNRKKVQELGNELDSLRNNIFYFIKNLEESSLEVSNFYLDYLTHLQDASKSLDALTALGYKHIDNNHKKLRFNQIKELKQVEKLLTNFFTEVASVFEKENYHLISEIETNKIELFKELNYKIEKQVERTRTDENSPKNTTLYFCLLLETKNLINSTINLVSIYKNRT